MVNYSRLFLWPRLVNDMHSGFTDRRRREVNKILLGTRTQAKSGVSHRKQRIGAHSTRYAKGVSLAFRHRTLATNPPGKRFLIETPPRIEIPVTHSYERRKHFLIETTNGFSRATRRESRATNHDSQGSIVCVSYWQQTRKHFLPYGKQPCTPFHYCPSRKIFSTRSISAGTSTLIASYSVSTTRMW